MTFDVAAFQSNQQVYENTAPAQRIELDCHAIANYDRELAKRRRRAMFMIVGGLVGFLLAVISMSLTPLLGGPLFILCIASFVTGIVLHNRWHKLDIPDWRYRLLPTVLTTLSRDMAPSSSLHCRMDCRPATHKSKRTATVPYPARRGWKLDQFRDDCLILDGQLVDGTDFRLMLTELAIAKYGWKRGRSGKNKFKRKEKPKGCELQLQLRFPRKRYGAVQVLQSDLQGAIQLPEEIRLKSLKATDHTFLIRVKAPPPALTPAYLDNLITQLFLNAYQVLNLAQKLSKRSG